MHQRLLTTHVFSVERRAFVRAGEAAVMRDIVIHPGAVVILPLLPDGRIVMIRNYRYSIEGELWELPAGTREPDETPIATARRELEEETGYRAGMMTPQMEFYTSPGICTERMSAFLATGLSPVGQRLQGGERIEVELLTPKDVRQRLIGGEFHDGKTIAVLARYFLGLNES